MEGRHAATTENSRQARSATQTDNLAQKRFKWRKDPARNLEIKKFPRHKPALWKQSVMQETNGWIPEKGMITFTPHIER
ncbi:hypothetical protein AUI07_00605 [archaeon 13_2_20CM_2_53_6]|nr:MAG: hypothetical protein AUI07_00605 [archaeon 13_2_20CM_2_53_6]